ncbi:hypothetical protein ACRDU6_00435 (plasmid) [Mycolicibacterium sp. ELW1]|uniref:hypothetical protein n=1 Tax=Mycobacteriaceae TaxID=1762 RepID=UPI0011EFE760|nr:hypothetical protein [Mycobacterium sp. ELW1]QEN17624.1 hypothetical protein D3H54_30635 [Mycobacterium sp. ELW1]
MTSHPDYTDWDRDIEEARAELLGSLADAINALTRAQRAVTALTSDQVFDVEFAEGTPGPDSTSFITDSVRNCRAAYHIVHGIIDDERP